MDSLEKLLSMQNFLNNAIFEKKQIRDRDGQILTMEKLRSEAHKGNLGPMSSVNEWLSRYLTALDDESRELKEELLWKWWSKDHLDMQNIRVEIIDQLHFWLSLALTAGLDAQQIMSIYEQKNAVNLNRQESDYSKSNKNEQDNKGITT